MLTLLKFYADWCGPCRAMNPIVEQLGESVIVSHVNIENNPHARQQYGIQSIPAFVLIRNQKEVGRKIGSCSLTEMKAFIEEHSGSEENS